MFTTPSVCCTGGAFVIRQFFPGFSMYLLTCKHDKLIAVLILFSFLRFRFSVLCVTANQMKWTLPENEEGSDLRLRKLDRSLRAGMKMNP